MSDVLDINLVFCLVVLFYFPFILFSSILQMIGIAPAVDLMDALKIEMLVSFPDMPDNYSSSPRSPPQLGLDNLPQDEK